MKKHWQLNINKLFYEHSSNVLLEDTYIRLNPDHIYGVMGESGSGKTSLWEALIRYPKSRLISDLTVQRNDQDWNSKAKIALVPQQPAYTLNPVINIRSSLKDVLQAHGKNTEDYLEEVKLKSSLEDVHLSQYPHELSGGELQRVAFALSLCMEADWLILDEPSASLDKLTAAELLQSAIHWKERSGGLLIISSHDGHLLSNYCDRIIYFKDNKLLGPFKTVDVLDTLEGKYPDLRPSEEANSIDPVIIVKKAKYSYQKGKDSFDLEASMDIPENSIIGLTGRSGSGKSTLGRILAGYIKGEEIDVRYADQIKSDFDIQYIPQDAILNFHPYQSMEKQLWPIYKKWNPSSDRTEMEEFLEAIDINISWLKHNIYELSGGQRQRFLLARALFSRPKLLILDETFSALDRSSVIGYINWLNAIHRDLGTGLFIISHDIRLLMSICQKIHVMSDGRLIDEIESGESENINRSAVTNALLRTYN